MSYAPDRKRTVQALREAGVTVVIGADHVRTAEDLVETVDAIVQFGYLPEVTFRISAALLQEAMAELRRRRAHAVQREGSRYLLGIGSVTTPEELTAALEMEPDYLVGPARFTTAAEARLALERAQRHGVAVVPGAFTPTEFAELLSLSPDGIKLFPARVLGPDGVGDLLAPFVRPATAGLLIMPTGGVTAENAPAFRRAVLRRGMTPVLGMSAPLSLVRERRAPGDRAVIEESLARFRTAFQEALRTAEEVR